VASLKCGIDNKGAHSRVLGKAGRDAFHCVPDQFAGRQIWTQWNASQPTTPGCALASSAATILIGTHGSVVHNHRTVKHPALKTTALVLGTAAFLLAALTATHRLRPRTTHLGGCLEEIGSVMFGFPVIAPRRDEVYYVRRQAEGTQLCIRNFATGQVTVQPLSGNTPQQGFTWSPDGRYLPIKTEGERYQRTGGSAFVKPQRLFVYDRARANLIAITTHEMVIGNYAVWLDNSSFLYSAATLGGRTPAPKGYRAGLDNGVLHEQGIDLPGPVLEALSGPRKLATACNPNVLIFCDGDAIDQLDLRSGAVLRISALSDGSFTGFNWLNWSHQSQRLLFCATRAGENYRNLFAYDPNRASVARLSAAHSYNGQWLQAGQGYAFVGNSNGNFSLWVHDAATATEVNLFTNGYVDRYVASVSGDYVVAIATTNGEPRGLWKYDLATKALTCVEPGRTAPFKHARVSEARSLTAQSSDGLSIPIHVFPPTDEAPGRKHPLVAYIPPRTGPAHRGYEIRPQLLANLGFYYAGINYRGCDGYGRKYSEAWDEEKAAEDVVRAIRMLAQQPGVDGQRVFAVSASAGSSVLQRLLRKFPGAVRAAAFLEPVPWEPDDLLEGGALPPLFISIGRNDSRLPFVEAFQKWTRAHGVPATFLYISNYAHFTQDILKREAEERALAEFLFNNM
jgi:pimeloyl-ACP methyl ester carboxylesterase